MAEGEAHVWVQAGGIGLAVSPERAREVAEDICRRTKRHVAAIHHAKCKLAASPSTATCNCTPDWMTVGGGEYR